MLFINKEEKIRFKKELEKLATANPSKDDEAFCLILIKDYSLKERMELKAFIENEGYLLHDSISSMSFSILSLYGVDSSATLHTYDPEYYNEKSILKNFAGHIYTIKKQESLSRYKNIWD